METSTINGHHPHNLHFPSNSQHSHPQYHSHSTKSLLHNGFDLPRFDISDIEMITFQTVTYTSLKDLLPPSSTVSVATSLTQYNSSWHEIPIKNPLVKQAAFAYLQPMSTPTEVGTTGFFGRLRKDGFGCFEWVNDVVLVKVRDVFCGTLDEDDVLEEEEKVD